MPNRDLSESDTFKAATGEDFIRVEGKGTPAFDYQNWAKMFFAANNYCSRKKISDHIFFVFPDLIKQRRPPEFL
ncbi:MAG: DUF5906 domain-containing protein [Bacteroidia bacterium]